MSPFSTRHIERSDETLAEMIVLGRRCFGASYDGGQLRRNWTHAPGMTFFGTFDGDRLVAFNGFIVFNGERDGRAVRLVQSCHSATDPEYRGRGLFSVLILMGKTALNADWLVGFGNSNSAPIMKKRLGFRSIPAARVYFPARAARAFLSAARLEAPQARRITLDEDAIAAWKSAEWPGEMVSAKAGGTTLWGRRGVRRIGPLSLPSLRVGGWRSADPDELARAIGALGVAFVEVVAPMTAAAVEAARWPMRSTSEAFNWLPNTPEEPQPAFDVYAGIKDNW